MKKTVTLLILDGWGIREEVHGNAIKLARPAFYEHLLATYPNIPIEASGEAVGLPDGQMGNSEVGHLNMGAGRVVYQEITRINKSIRDGDFFTNPVFRSAVEHVKSSGGILHLLGLVSDGGVHSALDHLLALLDFCKREGLGVPSASTRRDPIGQEPQAAADAATATETTVGLTAAGRVPGVRVHAFLDGRDVPPQSAEKYLKVVEEKLLVLDFPQIATINGRYYAMDRDQRWERTQQAYENLVGATGRKHLFSIDGLLSSYKEGIHDEFVVPAVTDTTYQGMQDGDAILFFNFRPDRARQITRAVTDNTFEGFNREKVLKNLYSACMTLYDESFNLPVAYPKQAMDQILAQVVSQHGLTQFRTAETEKYAHVTYFFNGGFEEPYPGEERLMIPSPKVATYDLQPEMNVSRVADVVCEALESGKYDLIITNFANPDMVGHTGILPAAEDAVKAVDEAIRRVAESVLKTDGTLLLTADHGNCEKMIDDDGGPHTAHTTDPVPLILISNNPKLDLDRTRPYALSDIAPTILDLLGLPKPAQMTSPSALVQSSVPAAAN